jgi:hypothetical protein
VSVCVRACSDQKMRCDIIIIVVDDDDNDVDLDVVVVSCEL